MKNSIASLMTALVGITICIVLMVFLYAADGPARAKVKQREEEAASDFYDPEKGDEDEEVDVTMPQAEVTTEGQKEPEVQENKTGEEGTGTVTRPDENSLKLKDVKARKLKLIMGKVGSAKKGGYSNIFEEPYDDSEVITRMTFNNAVFLAGSESNEDLDGWVAVKAKRDGTIGYVEEDTIYRKNVVICNTGDRIRDNVVYQAYKYMGVPFVMDGEDPDEGFDCSHFIHYIFAKIGMEVPDSPDKIFKSGIEVPEKEAQPGDIVFYDVNEGYGHVALYIGKGLVINATGHNGKSYPMGGVHITALTYKDREEYRIANIIGQ